MMTVLGRVGGAGDEVFDGTPLQTGLVWLVFLCLTNKIATFGLAASLLRRCR
jgi:hypothetical protein